MFTRYDKFRRPQHCRCPEACGVPYRMGVNDAHNTVEENIGAYNTVCVRAVIEYYSCRCIGYGPWHRGLTCAPCLAFSVYFLVPSERASPVGWSRSALVAPVGEEQRAGFLRTPVKNMGSKSKVVLWPGLPVGEAVRRRARSVLGSPIWPACLDTWAGP